VFTLVNLFFCHAWLIHVTFKQIQSRVYMSPCRGWCLSRVVASIHLITVDAGLQLGCCRADAGLLLNGCGVSPRAACKLLLSCCQTASRLLLGTCCRAGGRLLLKLRGFQSYFLASFGPRFWPRSEPVL
jgi:hypothetical protein